MHTCMHLSRSEVTTSPPSFKTGPFTGLGGELTNTAELSGQRTPGPSCLHLPSTGTRLLYQAACTWLTVVTVVLY